MPQNSFRAGDPWVVVAENTCVFLVSGRIRADLAEIQIIACVSRLQQHNAEFAVEPFLDALERFFGFACFPADPGHDTHSLRLDEDLPLGAVLTADGRAERVVGSAEPCAVPARVQHRFFHRIRRSGCLCRFRVQTEMAADIGVSPAVFDKHSGDEHGLRDRAFAGAGDLEALAGVGGEAVEIQTVVPVGSADERQSVRAEVCADEPEAAAQVLYERRGIVRVTVKRNAFIQYRPVTCFAQVSVHARDQPQRVVVEPAADCKISLLRERLILMIGAAVRELRGGDIQNALPRPFRNDMHEAQQVLTRIAEAHAAPHATFEVAG